MPPTLLSLALVFSTLSTLVLSATQSHQLYHRYLSYTSPSAVPSIWSERGSIHVDSEVDRAWFDDDCPSCIRVDQLPYPDDAQGGKVLYQLAVGQGKEHVISVDACILKHSTQTKNFNETLTLLYYGHEVSGLKYTTNSIREGCDTLASGKRLEFVRGLGHEGASMEVVIERPQEADEPIFRSPDPAQQVVVGEDGKVVAPPPEKGFLAKYWIYILPILVVLMMGGGDESTGPAGTAGGGGGAK